jgi:hypothetical protein
MDAGSFRQRRWLLEKIYEQFRSDLESAVGEKVSWLEQVRPGEGAFGEITADERRAGRIGAGIAFAALG